MNERAVAKAKELIDSRRYVLRSTWGEVQPSTGDENVFLERRLHGAGCGRRPTSSPAR